MAQRGSIGWFRTVGWVRRTARRLASRIPGLMLGLGAAATFAWASHAVLVGFGSAIGEMKEVRAAHRVERGGELSGDLFNDLARNGKLAFVARTGRLDLDVDCRAWNSGFLRAQDKEKDARIRNASARLCRSDIGAALASEIDTWNGRVSMVAVRDDWDASEPCQNKEKPKDYVPTGCHPGVWEASVPLGKGAAAAGLLGGAPAPDLFGFLALAQHERFGDWQRFDASGVRDGALILERRFDPRGPGRDGGDRARRMTIDVAGDLEDATWVDGAGKPAETIGVGEILCEGNRHGDDCRTGGSRGALVPRAHRIRIDVAAHSGRTLRLAVRPISVVEASVAALGQADFRKPLLHEGWREPDDAPVPAAGPVRSVRFTRHIGVQCDDVSPLLAYYDNAAGSFVKMPSTGNETADEKIRACRLLWDNSEERFAAKKEDPPGTVTIAAAGGHDKRALTDIVVTKTDRPGPGPGTTRIVANAETRRLGLIPVVGFDDHDVNSLLGRLRTRVPQGKNTQVDLTIDADLQAAAFGTIEGLMQGRPEFAAIAGHLSDEYDKRRRVAIVLVDAGHVGDDAGGTGFDKQTGRILAAATWPQVSAVLSEWDLVALETYRGATSPIATYGWSGNNRLNAPGSTFKPLVALAAIDKAARGDETVADMLGAEPGRDGLDAAAMERVLGAAYGFGWGATTLDVPLYAGRGRTSKTVELHNDHDEPVSAAALSRGKAGRFVDLDGAMAFSNNLWFARLALAIDENAVSTLQPDGNRVEYADAAHNGELTMSRVVARIWPKDALDLTPGLALGPYSRLRATRIQISETNPRLPRLFSVALNGIGQGGAQATPLALASVMASIATGVIVLPRLTPTEGSVRPSRGAPLVDHADVDGKPLDTRRADAMLAALRRSMASVVRRPGATAFAAFKGMPDLARRLHGKTGTAQVGSRDGRDPEANLNTVWFEGWVDGLMPRYADRRIAFACLVTHADRAGGSAGGSVCAPLIRKLFAAIERNGAAPEPDSQTGPGGNAEPSSNAEPAGKTKPAGKTGPGARTKATTTRPRK